MVLIGIITMFNNPLIDRVGEYIRSIYISPGLRLLLKVINLDLSQELKI